MLASCTQERPSDLSCMGKTILCWYETNEIDIYICTLLGKWFYKINDTYTPPMHFDQVLTQARAYLFLPWISSFIFSMVFRKESNTRWTDVYPDVSYPIGQHFHSCYKYTVFCDKGISWSKISIKSACGWHILFIKMKLIAFRRAVDNYLD